MGLRALLIRTFRRRTLDRDLDDELRFHLETRAGRYQQAGMDAREAAHEARHSFGNPTFFKEECRDMWTFQRAEIFWQDLRYAARTLRKSPGFSIVAVLTLALGIGANTAIYSVVNALLLRPLPYKDSSRLVRLWPTNVKTGPLPYAITSYPDFTDWKTQSHSFEQVEGYVPRSFNLSGGDQPQRVYGLRASAGLLALLGITPIHGRTFLAEETQPGKDHVLLLSEGLWQSRFARDPNVLGKTVKLNDENYLVIGILPAAFQFPPNNPCALVLPQPPDPSRGHGFLNVVARLKTGVTLATAQTEMETIARRLELQYPKESKELGVRVLGLQESYVGSFRAALLIFLSAVGFVLLIACANVANLFLARTASRQKEFVVRAAMGAGRFRLVRQLLTESALLGLAGGAAGLLFAYWGVKGLVALVHGAFTTAPMETVGIDGSVLGFTLGVSLLVGLLAGLAPALATTKVQLNDTLKEGRGLTGNRARNRIRGTLVVAEIALALVLLTGAGLMLKSFLILESVDPGIHPENVLVMDFSMGGKKYAKTQARAPFMDAVLHRVEQIPGVQSAAMASDVPLTNNSDAQAILIEGRPDPGPKQRPIVNVNVVGPGYLRTLGIPLLKGRDFSARDTESAPAVVLINQAMARKLWPNEDPTGARISADGKNWATIQGVVGDVRQLGLMSESKPEIYLSYLQDPFAWPYFSLLVHTSSDPMKQLSSIQDVVWSVDKDLPIAAVATMEHLRSGSIAQPRVTALLLVVFASLALILASVGIYGVMAYSVTQRTHEMGLRMALGARITDVLKLVLGHGMILTGCGVGLGLIGAFALTRVLTKFLWGVRPTDPVTFIAVSTLLAAVAMLATYLPARRATKVDPMVALRYE